MCSLIVYIFTYLGSNQAAAASSAILLHHCAIVSHNIIVIIIIFVSSPLSTLTENQTKENLLEVGEKNKQESSGLLLYKM